MLVAALCMAGPVHADYATPYPMDRAVFTVVCDWLKQGFSQLKCEEIDPPWVVTTDLVDEVNPFMTSYGMYVYGEKAIYIDSDAPTPYNTMVHETIHYINHEAALGIPRCEGERIARLGAGQPWGPLEMQAYKCVGGDKE